MLLFVCVCVCVHGCMFAWATVGAWDQLGHTLDEWGGGGGQWCVGGRVFVCACSCVCIIIIIIIRLTCQVPLKVGRTAPMFVLSFFLHSILSAGSALDSFQCLRSLLIVSFHVFFGLPRPRCPTTSNSVMLLIKPSFLTTCPNQRSRLYLNKVCMLLIPSFLSRESELMWSFNAHYMPTRIIARSLRCSLSRSLTLGAQHSLAYNKTVRIYVLYICPRVMYERAREVNIGKSSRNLPHADRILIITHESVNVYVRSHACMCMHEYGCMFV